MAEHSTNGARCDACGLLGWPRPCRREGCTGFEHVHRIYLIPGEWEQPPVDWRCDLCLASGHIPGSES
ncbi:MAG TPA: hypothetical protein VLX59_07805 [Acidimicrobiales bacterium]|nr:hypothetical protein [Acidimicrobiales bacterium]